MLCGMDYIPTLAYLPAATPAGLGGWLVNAAAVLAIVYIVVKLINTFRRRPPIDATFATKTEFAGCRAESQARALKTESKIEEMEHILRKDITGLRRESEERGERVHKRVDEVLASTSRLEGRIEGMLRRD